MKIGFNCSTFDLFHAGHVTMLREEKRHCDYLIVAIQVDPTLDRPDTKNKPVMSIYERFVCVSACRYVDEVVVYHTEEDLLNILKTQHIDIRFLGAAVTINNTLSDNLTVAGNVTLSGILSAPQTTKASNATGTVGQICWDANYIHVCTATNTWKRSPLTGGY